MAAALTALPFAILWSWLFATMQHRTFGEILPLGLLAGILFGVLFGITMAFFFKGDTITIAVHDKGSFAARLHIAISQLGFQPAGQTPQFLQDYWFFTYKPSFQAGLLSGRIAVLIYDDEATIVGPKIYVAKLQKKLSVTLSGSLPDPDT
jgi:hypothetical protein